MAEMGKCGGEREGKMTIEDRRRGNERQLENLSRSEVIEAG